MSLTPEPVVTDIEKAKPRLVIIEDQPAMLGRFVKNFEALGYKVIPVVVAQPDKDVLFHDGQIDKTLLSSKINELRADQGSWSALMNYEALAHFQYGVKNRTELRALLQELKPDLILSDERMRLDRKNIAPEEVMAADDNVLRGWDVMRIAKEMFPHVPRAIHTAIYDANFAPVPPAAERKARVEGHMIFAKDDYEAEEQPQAEVVHAYFQQALEKSRARG